MSKKLFVWTSFNPDYTNGLAFAIANTVEEAKEIIENSIGYKPYQWGELHIHKLNEKIGYGVGGGG